MPINETVSRRCKPEPEINEGSNPSITLQPPTTQRFHQQRLSWVNHSLPREKRPPLVMLRRAAVAI
ncbi:hypothetical protein JMJ77_0004664 [Colletotrichum scovillei]|uniref:Uncharacterized protein n=1 Tax=Colletotrichum scovillei TaxID=1209932 RepID=A0A9P7RJ51_9PEZI|nr:hypothetical protein JMJ77_0004664 [Colletotrichum scovillei]KAG7075840.1 hypothetical protein JMJ76_0013115 [Colletotrichum scovillei]KAG7082955.1 hypothetical protein JMJ78_0008408 [Colletotrichum scovillei]